MEDRMMYFMAMGIIALVAIIGLVVVTLVNDHEKGCESKKLGEMGRYGGMPGLGMNGRMGYNGRMGSAGDQNGRMGAGMNGQGRGRMMRGSADLVPCQTDADCGCLDNMTASCLDGNCACS